MRNDKSDTIWANVTIVECRQCVNALNSCQNKAKALAGEMQSRCFARVPNFLCNARARVYIYINVIERVKSLLTFQMFDD
jgi:hypothetical protein